MNVDSAGKNRMDRRRPNSYKLMGGKCSSRKQAQHTTSKMALAKSEGRRLLCFREAHWKGGAIVKLTA